MKRRYGDLQRFLFKPNMTMQELKERKSEANQKKEYWNKVMRQEG